MREPTRRTPVSGLGWNERAAVALLVLVAGHLLAAEPASAARPLTPDRLARFVPGLPVALADPYFRLALAKAARQAGLDLFPLAS